MRILMLAPQPFFEPRGTPFSILGRLRALSSLGYQVDLVTYPLGQDVAIPGVTIHRTARVPFVKTIKIGPSLKKLVLDGLLFLKAARMLRSGRYDLLHTHEEASFFGVLLARLFKVPHLYDMHSSLVEQLGNMRFSGAWPLVRTFEWMERCVINASVAVITICPALEGRVKEINGGVPQMMIENVASGRDPATVSLEEVRALQAAHSLPGGKKVVLYTGTLESYQGIDLLVESARQVLRRRDDVLFLLVGGKPEQVQFYQEVVDNQGISAYFHFTGVRPPTEVPSFVSLADVLVSPRTDGTNTPLKIYSYLQSGKPIVATNLAMHTQVLDSSVAVLPAPDAEDFAQGVLCALEDQGFAGRLGAQARELYKTYYSYETYMDKTEQVLRLALGTARPPQEDLASEAD